MSRTGLRTIGLTGGIGSGKSTVGRTLVECGAWLVDTDAIARALTAPGGVGLPALAREFGAAVIGVDGALDRQRMREIVFSDRNAKTRLEGVLHPMIGAEAQRQAAQAGQRIVVYDVPLLTESRHWRARVDRVLVVDCEVATQIRRVQQRSGWSQEQIDRVVAQQAPRAARRAIADAVIFNEGLDEPALRAEVRTLWSIWHGG